MGICSQYRGAFAVQPAWLRHPYLLGWRCAVLRRDAGSRDSSQYLF